MEPESVRALRGPNVWARCTALEATYRFDEGALSPAEVQAFESRLRRLLPSLPPARAELSHGALALAHGLERAAFCLLAQAGCAVAFSHTAPAGAGCIKVVVEYREEPVGRRALESAQQLVDAALRGGDFDVAASLASLRALDEDVRLGPSTGSIARAAARRGIPVRRLNEASLVQFGWGCRQRRILAAETDRTGAIAESIAQDKELTKMLLRSVGVPVPDGRPVESAEEAWEVACELGLPVVVKPQDGNQGRGVAVNLTTREQVLAAYAAARQESSAILVERFAPGADHRLLVVGGKVVAAARREPPQVLGDGVHTIAQLVDKVNSDPRRGDGHATSLTRIRLDSIGLAVLAEQGLEPLSIPPAGKKVVLRRNANLSTGGSAEDVTDKVHPDLAARAVDAARVVGLDIAGIDVVCEDVSRPLEDQRGVIVEVNAAPGLRMHLEPSAGTPRPVGEAIVNLLFAEADNGRIPVIAVSGTNGKTTTVRLIAHLLRTAGKRVGMTCTDGVYVDDRRVDTGDCSGPKSARNVLLNPEVEAAVLETARGGILREGLGFDRCDVAVVTNVGDGDHLGLNGIDTAEQLAAVKRTVVENVAPGGAAVLNAADPLTAQMAPSCPGGVVFFARDGRHPVLAARRSRGGRVVFAEGDAIWAAEGAWTRRVIGLADVPLTQGGRVGFEVENALAATAAAWSAKLAWEVIAQGLATFVNDPRRAPARFNVLSHRGATLVLDYGHNAHALTALVEALDRMPHQRRLVVISGAGDRRDQDIVRQGEIVGNGFDEVILYEDACNRGRTEGEVVGLLRKGVQSGRRARAVEQIRGEFNAIDACLARLRAGDLALVLVDQIEASLAYVEKALGSFPKVELPAQPAVAAAAPETPRPPTRPSLKLA